VFALAGVILACGGLALGFALDRGGSGGAGSTTHEALLTIQKPPLIRVGAVILNEPDSENQDWLDAALSPLSGAHRYQITVTNASNVGYVNSFEWYPPTGAHILSVMGSSAGHCAVTGLSGFGGNQFTGILLYPKILCDTVDLKPPSCTCRGDGGSMTVSFVLDQPAFLPGAARVVTATPSLNVIPSYVRP
jgi:hypothetical protein